MYSQILKRIPRTDFERIVNGTGADDACPTSCVRKSISPPTLHQNQSTTKSWLIGGAAQMVVLERQQDRRSQIKEWLLIQPGLRLSSRFVVRTGVGQSGS